MPVQESLTTQAEPAAPLSLRDTLSAAYDEVEKESAPAPASPSTPSSEAVAPAAVATEPKADDAGRVRAPDGKFAAKAPEAPASEPPLQRPSSWKKDYWGHWDKLTKGEALTRDEAIALAKYQHEREGDFAKGVSTYKQSWDSARPVMEALHQHRELLQKANATPEQFVSMAANTHHILTNGSPQDKLKEIARFADAYKVPLHELFVQGDDGKIYFNQQYANAAAQPAPAAATPDDINKIVAQQLALRERNTQIKSFLESKDATGNPAHPHAEAVWKTMDGLLRTGLAQDLPSAYKAALALPIHSDLSPPQLQPGPDEAEKKRLAQEAARKANAKTVSPRNQAQTSLTTAAPKRDGLRASLESAFDQHLGSGGRV